MPTVDELFGQVIQPQEQPTQEEPIVNVKDFIDEQGNLVLPSSINPERTGERAEAQSPRRTSVDSPYQHINEDSFLGEVDRYLAELDVRTQQNQGAFLTAPLMAAAGLPGVGTAIAKAVDDPPLSRMPTAREQRTQGQLRESFVTREPEKAQSINTALDAEFASQPDIFGSTPVSNALRGGGSDRPESRSVASGGPGASPNRGDISNAGR